MAQSGHAEKTWKDIREAAFFGMIGRLFILPGCFLESSAQAIENFAKRETKRPPLMVVLRPLKVMAGDIDRAGSLFSKHDRFLFGTAIAAAGPALFAGGKAALMLGFSWPALAAGGHLLGMAGAALGGIAAAVAVYPLAAFTTACAVTLTMGLGLAVGDAPKIWRSCQEGLRESLAWRPARKAPGSAQPAPVAASPAAPIATPAEAPPLMKDFNTIAASLQKQDEAERIRFLKSLRRKYPGEFADALRLEHHAPELRKDIQVKKPLSFKAKRRGFRFMPGARP